MILPPDQFFCPSYFFLLEVNFIWSQKINKVRSIFLLSQIPGILPCHIFASVFHFWKFSLPYSLYANQIVQIWQAATFLPEAGIFLDRQTLLYSFLRMALKRWLEGFSNFQKIVRGKVSGFTQKIFLWLAGYPIYRKNRLNLKLNLKYFEGHISWYDPKSSNHKNDPYGVISHVIW